MTILSNKKQGTQQNLPTASNPIDNNDTPPQNSVHPQVTANSPILSDIESLNSKNSNSDEAVPAIASNLNTVVDGGQQQTVETASKSIASTDEAKTVNIQINDIQNVSGPFYVHMRGVS